MNDRPDDHDPGERLCPDCQGYGFFPHDCGEDSCCCADPYDEECWRCGGTGYIERQTEAK